MVAHTPAFRYLGGTQDVDVILHDRRDHTQAFVTDCLFQDLPVSAPNAYRLMLIAHYAGRSLVMTAHRELAEMYRDRLAGHGLHVTLEPSLN
ncbi:MAG: ATP-dependent Clp protease adaptor ClpS [Planctomycetota bacterium]